MELMLFIWNMLLTIFLSASLLLAIIAYLKYKKNIFLYIVIIFALYLFDNTIIFSLEMYDTLNSFYTNTYLSSPVIKIFMYGLLGFSYLNSFHIISKSKIKICDYIIFIVFLSVISITPTIISGKLGSNIFYHSIQVYFIGISIAQFLFINKNYKDQSLNSYKKFFLLFILFNSFIIMEDIYVINFVDSYNLTDIDIYYRSVSENILTLFLSYVFVKEILFALLHKNKHDTFEHISNIPNNITKNDSKKNLAIISFAKYYNFTERELEVFMRILEFKNSKTISEELYLSIGTIKTHIHNIYIKTEVSKKRDLLSLYEEYKNSFEKTKSKL